MKFKRTLFNIWAVVLGIALLGACTNQLEEDIISDTSTKTFELKLAHFITEDGVSSLPQEDAITDMTACLFNEGKFVSKYELSSSQKYKLELPLNTQGILYTVANVKESINWDVVTQLSEDEWKKLMISSTKEIPMFFSGSMTIEPENQNQSIYLKRGVARFDVKFKKYGAKINNITFKQVADGGYLFGQQDVLSPDNCNFTDKVICFDVPIEKDTQGVAYVYEQKHADSKVELIVNDKQVTVELPDVIERNTVYTLQIGQEGSSITVSVEVTPWSEEAENIVPDLSTLITINKAKSDLDEKASISTDSTSLIIAHQESDIKLAINCDEELEAISNSPYFTITKTSPDAVNLIDRNTFSIHKKLIAPGVDEQQTIIQFKRRDFEAVYEEDKINIILEENPIQMTGRLQFDVNTYECDFNNYVEGELGEFILPEGKMMRLEVDSENPWARIVEKDENGTKKYALQGGWKPNDLTGDGRVQEAKLVVYSEQNNSEEVYTVKRRNYSMPVTYINGRWWCKYNAINNSKQIEEQILVNTDPAKDKDVLEYLNTCSVEDYLKLWAAYQGASGKGMKVIVQNEKFMIDGHTREETNNINALDPTILAPEGYQVASYDDYQRIFGGSFPVWKDSGPYKVGDGRWGQVSIKSGSREDLKVDMLVMPKIYHFKIYNSKNESITFYGPGTQWDGNGIHHNQILFSCYSSGGGSGWMVNGNGTLGRTAGSATDTRILRFIKSPTPYVYGTENIP